jgi:hypothetical protein
MKTTRHNVISPIPPIFLKKGSPRKVGKNGAKSFPSYPLYPPSEDIYNNQVEEEDIDPERIALKKNSVGQTSKLNQNNIGENVMGSDLDVPGSELDDAQEKIGSEDEENNYYSIGGDNHNDLEESKV